MFYISSREDNKKSHYRQEVQKGEGHDRINLKTKKG